MKKEVKDKAASEGKQWLILFQKQLQWTAFLRKTRIEKIEKEFNEVTKRITDFLQPIVVSIRDKTAMKKWWNNEKGIWEDE
jgi:hypothetical protein